MTPTQRATARLHRRGQRHAAIIDSLENAVASAAVTGLVAALRGAAFDDGYIAACLLAGATSLIRSMPNKAPWSELLQQLSYEAPDER